MLLEDLAYLLSLPDKYFSHKIWLNAVWFENKWYQILRVTDEKRFIREYIEDGDAEEIPAEDLEKFQFQDAQFNNGDSLVYDPFHDKVFKRYKGYGKFSYICTHLKEYKAKVDVEVLTVDENDEPISAFLWVNDRVGTDLTSMEDGKFVYPGVEIDTRFTLNAGYSPMEQFLESMDIVVAEDMALPIKIPLVSHKVSIDIWNISFVKK